MKDFLKSESPGPYGWSVKILLEFFDTMGINILEVVEDSGTSSTIYEGLNSTYITLIPKVRKPITFNDFRLVSLCNLVYDIISKIFTKRIKSILSKFISKEHFGFLDDRKNWMWLGLRRRCSTT